MNEKVKAFAFAAGEFLDEELWELEDEYGEDIKFFKDGECRENKESQHPFEYWSSQEGCDELNQLINAKKDE